MRFIDVSHYQGDINWARVARNFQAAYMKASEGTTWTDPDFHKNRKAANAAKVRIGAYHFAGGGEPGPEALHFLSVVDKIGDHDLKPVLDLETNPSGFSASRLVSWAREFNQTVQKHTGVIPMFYSYSAFIEDMTPTKPIGNGLWLAAYGRNDGLEHPVAVPSPWKSYVAHQFTSQGKVPGINGNVDISDAPKGIGPLLAHPLKDVLGRL